MKKFVITLLIFLIMIISVSAVSAADDASDLVASDDATVSVANTDTAVTADEPGNFTKLSQLIAGSSGELTLSSDYKRNGTGDAIELKNDIIIHGNGHTIDGSNGKTIFSNAKNKKITLENIIFKNVDDTSSAVVSNGNLEVKNCVFENINGKAGISSSGGSVSLSNNTIDSDKPILSLEGTLASPCTVKVDASIDDTNWKKIDYAAKVYDDNNNRVWIDDTVGTWTVRINDDMIANPEWYDGGIKDEAYAKTYGEQVIRATNTVLANPTINAATVFVTPGKQDSIITVTPETTEWNYTVTITVTIQNYTDPDTQTETNIGVLYPSGKVNVTIDGAAQPIVLDLVNGSANYTIDNVQAKTYSIRVDYAGDEVFKTNTSVVKQVVVTPKAPEINITVDNSTFGVQVITIELPSDVIGIINATISGTQYLTNKNLTDGKCSFTANLAADDNDPYEVIVDYAPISEGYNYNATHKTKEFWVTKLTSDVNITVENVTYGENAIFTIKVNEEIGNATVIVKDHDDGEIYNQIVNFTDGSATIDLGVIKADNYTVTVKTLENAKYRECTNGSTFEVAKATPTVVIIAPEKVDLFEEFNVTVMVDNYNGEVTLFNGTTIGPKSVDETGTAIFSISLDSVGLRKITAEFAPTDNENYTKGTADKVVDVALLVPQITVEVGTVNIGQSASVNITVAGNTQAVPTGNVKISRNGVPVETVPLVDGKAINVVIGSEYISELGNYDFDVVYDSATDLNYTDNSATFTIKVTRWDVPVVIEVGDEYKVTDDIVINVTAGSDIEGYPAFTGNFTVYVWDQDFKPVINKSIALKPGVKQNLTCSLPLGVYIATVEFEGDAKHSANGNYTDDFTVKGVIENLTVVVNNVTYPDQAVATVNASVPGEYNVSVYNGDKFIKNYTVEVNDAGIGEVSLDILSAGEYTVKVVSLMDDYVVETNKTTFKVEKSVINATLTVPDVAYGENVTAYITADVDGNYTIKYGTEGVEVEVVDGEGYISAFIRNLEVGSYTLDLWTPNNGNYSNNNSKVNSTTVNVVRANVTVSVSAADIDYHNKPVVVVNTSAPVTFRVFLNGEIKELLCPNPGVYNVTFDNEYALIPATYEVTAVADETPNYNGVRANTSLTVNKGNIQFEVVVGNITYTNETQAKGYINVNPVGMNATEDLGYEIEVSGNDYKYRFHINGNDTDKNFKLPVLAPGVYTVKITPKADDEAFKYYNVDETSIFNTTTFEVKKGLINFTINASTPVTYPNVVEVNITSNVTSNFNVSIGGMTKKVRVVAGTTETVKFDGLDVSLYRLTVTNDHENYTTTTKIANVVVNYGDIEAEVVIKNVPYYTSPVAVVNSATGVTGRFNVTINGEVYTVDVVNGTGKATIPVVLDVGTYSAILSADIENYNPLYNDSASFEVVPATVNITVDVPTVEYPNKGAVTVYANASGWYNITIDGYDSKVVTIDTPVGVVANYTWNIDLLPLAEYKVNVTKVDGNPNFVADVAEAVLNVTKGNAEIFIKVYESYQVLDNVTITVIVPYGTGWVNITDGTHLLDTVQLVNYTANYTAEVQKLGTHVIYVELFNDSSFKNSLNQTNFVVTPIPTGLDIECNESIVYEDEVVITLNITGLKSGVAPAGNVIIMGYNVTQAAVAGEMTFNLGKLAGGNYTVNVTYTGDTKYAAYSELLSFTVEKFTPTVNATATGATYPNDANITFVSDRTGNFTIVVFDGHDDVAKVIQVGIVENNTNKTVLIDGLAAGSYDAIVVFRENENYTRVVTPVSFGIDYAKATIDANVTGATYPACAYAEVISSETGEFEIDVYDKDGAFLFYVTGDVVANESSIIDLDQLGAGDYVAEVYFRNENYTAGPIYRNFTIEKGTPVILIDVTDATYPEHGIVNISCNVDGEYTITVGTFTATGNFTAEEFVAIDVGILAADTYSVDVDYIENENYTALTRSSWLVIEQATPEIFILVDTTEILENATLLVGIPLATGDFVTINGVNVELVDYMGLGEYAEYNIGILKAGTYNFTAVYAGDKNLTAGNETITFTVEKLPSNLVVTVENTTYGTNPIMIVTLDNNETVIVNFVFDDEIEQAGIIKNGSVSGEIVGMAAGDHKVVVTYGGSDIYEAETQTAYYTIDKAPINIEVVVDDVVYPSPITVTVKADVAGTYTVKLGTTTEEITLEADVAQDLIFVKPAGTYDVTVSRAESENYTNASVSTEVTLEKGDVNINITVPDVTYPEDIVVTIVADVAGDYTVKLEDITQLVTLEPGVAKDVKFFGLNAGDYLVIAAYEETQNYTGAVEVEEVTVDKAVVNLVVEGDDVTYPEDAYVTVSTDLTGVYTLEITGISIENVTLNAGTPVKFIVPYYNAGIYEAIVTYAGSENYYPALDYDYVIVDKADVNMSITSSDVTYPDDVVVTVVSDVAGTYYVYLDVTSPKVVALEPGVPRDVIFSDLDAGTYEFTLAYLETENFNAAVESINVTVNKVENTTITVEATSPSLGENATITVTLPADATGTVDVKYGNGVYSAPVVDGVAVVSVPTTVVGTDTATVQYSGDTNYAPASGSVDITVLPQGIIIAENIRRGVNSPYDYYATLVDAGGNPIEGVEITFTIAGNTFKAVTNASGVATIFAGLEVIDGKDTPYAVVVTNPYTLENTTATTTIVPRLIVVSGDLTADYLENPPYIVQAIGDDGNPVGANVTVRIVFAGFYYDMQTNATGHVERTIALAPGSYAVRGEYAGYKTEQTAFRVLQILKASSGTLKKTAKSYTLKATLKHTNGRVIAGATVKLNFNGKTYTVKTNAKGVASYTLKSSQIKKLTAGKTYVLKALYVNDWTKGQWQGKIKVVNK